MVIFPSVFSMFTRPGKSFGFWSTSNDPIWDISPIWPAVGSNQPMAHRIPVYLPWEISQFYRQFLQSPTIRLISLGAGNRGASRGQPTTRRSSRWGSTYWFLAIFEARFMGGFMARFMGFLWDFYGIVHGTFIFLWYLIHGIVHEILVWISWWLNGDCSSDFSWDLFHVIFRILAKQMVIWYWLMLDKNQQVDIWKHTNGGIMGI